MRSSLRDPKGFQIREKDMYLYTQGQNVPEKCSFHPGNAESTMYYHPTPPRMATIPKTENNKC